MSTRRAATHSRRRSARRGALATAAALSVSAGLVNAAPAAAAGPTVVDPNLAVHTALGAASLTQPIGMAFLPDRSAFVIEKASGKVKYVTFTSPSGSPTKNGTVVSEPLDLAVNSASERGLLGIALHPDFASTPLVYLYWTESTSGVDTTTTLSTPLLGNRVDAYRWDPLTSRLTHEHNVIKLRALQNDQNPGAAPRGNHDGGVIDFGPDGKLYIVVGDVGRRGAMQNLPNGPATQGRPNPICALNGLPPTCDDQYGGPEPDNAHLTGVVLRLNGDGSAPSDNPFHAFGAQRGGEVGANLQKVYAYGVRNSFGLDFDPVSGDLWMQENGEDSFDEINRVEAGQNGGWIQIAGPAARYDEYRALENCGPATESTPPCRPAFNLYERHQQARWGPDNLAPDAPTALSRLHMLPGAHYSNPEFAWKHQVPPAGIAFVEGSGLGRQYAGNLLVGAARPNLHGGHLFRMRLTGQRNKIAVDDPRLEDRVADNAGRHDITESESLLFGKDFGVVPDLGTGPDGTVYAVSLTHNSIYQIHRNVAASP